MGFSDFLTFFNSKAIDKYEKKIKDLETSLTEKTQDLDYALQKIEKLEIELATSIPSKQAAIVNKNLQYSKTQIDKYKVYTNAYDIDVEKNISTYMVDLDVFFPKPKFSEIIEKLNKDGIFFVQDIKEFDLNEISSLKNSDEAYNRFKDFHNNKMLWDVRIALYKGEKITKVFVKYRKIVNFFLSKNIEYMDDIIDFDFESLKEFKFKESEIEAYNKVRKDYIAKYKIK